MDREKMTTELTVLSQVQEFKAAIKNWKPVNKSEAIKAIHFLSTISTNEKSIKEKAYGFLDTRCADCDSHSDGELTVTKVEVNKPLYGDETEEMVKLKTQIDKLTAKYKELKEATKTDAFQTTHYYKTK